MATARSDLTTQFVLTVNGFGLYKAPVKGKKDRSECRPLVVNVYKCTLSPPADEEGARPKKRARSAKADGPAIVQAATRKLREGDLSSGREPVAPTESDRQSEASDLSLASGGGDSLTSGLSFGSSTSGSGSSGTKRSRDEFNMTFRDDDVELPQAQFDKIMREVQKSHAESQKKRTPGSGHPMLKRKAPRSYSEYPHIWGVPLTTLHQAIHNLRPNQPKAETTRNIASAMARLSREMGVSQGTLFPRGQALRQIGPRQAKAQILVPLDLLIHLLFSMPASEFQSRTALMALSLMACIRIWEDARHGGVLGMQMLARDTKPSNYDEFLENVKRGMSEILEEKQAPMVELQNTRRQMAQMRAEMNVLHLGMEQLKQMVADMRTALGFSNLCVASKLRQVPSPTATMAWPNGDDDIWGQGQQSGAASLLGV